MKKYIVDWVNKEGQRLLCGTEAKSKASIKRELEWQEATKVRIIEYKRGELPEGLRNLEKNSLGIEAYK